MNSEAAKTYVRICGHKFEVVRRDPVGRSDNNMGRFDMKQGRIYLDREMSTDIADSTLVHEWLHGVFDLNGQEVSEQAVGLAAIELFRCGFRVEEHRS
jgi:hypothetical protein